MGKISDHIKEADWKSEKHVPVIECPDKVKAGEPFIVTVSVGKEIPHPNTTEHHIRWISLYFHPKGENQVYEVGHYEFNAHAESVKGANQGPVLTEPIVQTTLKIKGEGALHAVALCNIHGLWQSTKEVTV
jgi:superoxide reductase